MAPFPPTLDGSEIKSAVISSTILKRDESFSHLPLSSISSSLTSRHVLKPPPHNYHPGSGAKPPQAFNNKAYFALFAILGAGMVLTSIWFFFWAKNGGFVWQKGDWDDYKSTVLRRKGKDGKTLSNATPATDLGEKSIAGTFDVERDNDMFGTRDYTPRRYNNAYKNNTTTNNNSRKPYRPPKRREPSDDDLRAYRHEKPARVGGLNREQDGSHFDFTSSPEPSEVVSNNSRVHLHPKGSPSSPPKKKGFMEKKRERAEEKKAEKRMKQERKTDRKNRYAFAADEASDAGGGAAPADPYSPHYRRSLHPTSGEQFNYPSFHAPAAAPSSPHVPSRRHEPPRPYSGPGRSNVRAGVGNQPRRSSPLKGEPRFPGAFDAYEDDDAASDTGTKIYAHHIPQLSRGSRDAGFRRGGGGRMGRRDSLSDSENGDLGGRRM